MRVIVDESLVRSRTRIGERALSVGLLLVLVTIILAVLRPEWWPLILILSSAGLSASLVGGYLGERFVGPLAYHKKVPLALKGLDDRYTLLMYKLPSPFVLVEPSGLTVIKVKSQDGNIVYENGAWRHREKWGFLKRFAGQESIGKPEQQAWTEVEQVNKLLKKLPLNDEEIPVRPLILFINPRVQLSADECPVPALRAAKLKSWLRGPGRESALSDDILQHLYEVLEIEEDEGSYVDENDD